MSRHKIVAAAAVCAGIAFCATSCGSRPPAYSGPPVYAAPESFLVDPGTGTYYVSNVNPGSAKNNGYITTLDKDLRVLKHKFVEGGRDGVVLNDPKGLAIVGDALWVADLTVVRAFNKTTGKPTANVSLEEFGAVFLNDVAAGPDGVIFVSDTQANTVFRIDTKNENAVSVFAEGDALNNPNGLYWDADEKVLYVACWNGGTILTVDAEGAIGTFMANAERFAHLDGIDRDEAGNFFVSDYSKNVVYRITPDRQVEALPLALKTPADISLDRANRRLLIPQFAANTVTTFTLAAGE